MTTEKKPAVQKKTFRRLTSAQKAEAIALWRAGTHTVDDLATKFKKDRTTLLALFKKEGAVKGEHQAETQKRVQEEVEKAIVDDAVVIAQRIRETKEEGYKLNAGIAKLTSHIIGECRRANKPIGTVMNDIKTLKMWAETVRITREERFVILGINDDDANEDRPLPDLVVQELTAEDIKKMHSQQVVEIDGLEDIEMEGLGDEELVAELEADEQNERIETE